MCAQHVQPAAFGRLSSDAGTLRGEASSTGRRGPDCGASPRKAPAPNELRALDPHLGEGSGLDPRARVAARLARERAAITQEELRSHLAEQMNKAMYTLSIVAAIFLPLSLLTGLLGINVAGIPGTENHWAFTIVTVAIVAMGIGLVAWFKKIHWL